MSRNPLSEEAVRARPFWKRLLWLVVIWCASIAVLSGFAWLLRQFMGAAGLSTP